MVVVNANYAFESNNKKNSNISSMKKEQPKVVVGAFIFNDKDELILTKQPKWNNNFSIPGGGVEYGEDLVSAVKREVKEELNLRIKDIELLSVNEAVDLKDAYKGEDKHLVFINYKARAKKVDNIKLDKKGTEYVWKKPKNWLGEKKINKSVKEVIKSKLMEDDDYKNMYLRALADYQNLLKRSADEKQEFAKYANEQLLMDILPVYDNLKVSLVHIDAEAQGNGWAEGIKYVVKQFKDFLNGVGVEEIETVDQKFDHNTMEALEGEGEKVVKELKAGYKLKGKVIVPAKVVVGS